MDDLLSIAVSNAVAATVLALAASAAGALYRRPALVHGLWLLVLLKLVTPPLLFLPVSWPAAAEAPPEVASVREEPISAPAAVVEERAAPVIDPPASEEGPPGVEDPGAVDALGALTQPRSPAPPGPPLWPQLLRIVWGVGALAWFLLALERLHRFRRLLRFAQPAPAALQERTRRLAHSLGLKRCPRIRLLPGRIAPMLWAIGGSPRLLVPADLLDVLNDEQLDTLLLHELAHLRRRDHWVRVLEFIVMGLYWWHPVVWYARRELREAEEQCCDAWVVSTLPGTGRTYASALLDTLDFLSTAQATVPPLASGLGQIADLKRRLIMIMQANTPRSLTWPGCLAVVALGLTFLPMLPSLHGQPPRNEEDASRAEVEAAEARLRAAEAQLKAAAAMAAKARADFQRQKEAVKELKKNKPEREKKAVYHIEITLPADGSVGANEIVEKIKKALPGRLRGNIVLRPVAGTENPSGGVRPVRPPRPPRQPEVKALMPPGFPGRPDNAQDKRINELEKKLEKVLRELQKLQKQMEQPRGGPTYDSPLAPLRPDNLLQR